MHSTRNSFSLLLAASVAVALSTGCGSISTAPGTALSTASGSSASSASGNSPSGSSGSSGSTGSSGSGSSGSPSSGSGSSGSSGSGSSGSSSGSSGSGSSGSSGSSSGPSGSSSGSGSNSGSGSSGSGSSGSGSSGSGSSGSSGSGSSAPESTPSGAAAILPANAVAVSAIQAKSTWQEADDSGTSGATSGAMSVVNLPSLSGQAREFDTTYSDQGGERYWTSFGADTSATNFLYDAWIYLPNSAAGIDTLELDMNQVLANGQTVIYGFQCDGNNHTWDYTENAGSPTNYVDHWIHSSQPCNVHNWTNDAWHHIQVWYSRDDSGNVTYHTVWLDGAEQDIDATVPSAFALGWAPTLLTNFQVDGQGASGSSTAYIDKLTVYRW